MRNNHSALGGLAVLVGYGNNTFNDESWRLWEIPGYVRTGMFFCCIFRAENERVERKDSRSSSMKHAVLSIVCMVLFIGLAGCGSHHHPTYPPEGYPQVVNRPNDFSITFRGHIVGALIDRPLLFSSSKIKLALISANTFKSGTLIIQLYRSDNSMPFRKTISLSGDITLEETIALDFVPARIIVDIPDYAANGGFIFQVQAVQ